MNKLQGKIKSVEVSDSLSIVSISITENIVISAIVIETPASSDYLKVGNTINVLFKETEVIIGSNEPHAISLQNRISGSVKIIEKGKLISKITVATEVGNIESIISSKAVEQLNLQEELAVEAMVKLNEIMLSK